VVDVTRRGIATVLTVVMLVIAGCSAPVVNPTEDTASKSASSTPTPTESSPSTATPTESASSTTTVTDTPSPTATPEGGVAVYGDLPVNATLIWERVESLLGGEYDPPTVTVRERAIEPQTAEFAGHLGLDAGIEEFDEGRARASYARRTGRVRLSPRNASTAQVRRILAHEYVHAVQFRRVGENRTTLLDRVAARESFGAQRAIIEGSAVYVEDTFTRQFLGFSAIEERCAEYENGTPYERYAGQAYCFGGRYFASQLDSPSEILSPNTSLPNTTEQVLHPGSTEPPANLTIVDETPSDWYTPASFSREGELFVRTVLGVELSEERAVDAAEGWGDDRLVRVTGDTEGYVWVLRWDTSDDADEFETAFTDYLDARGNETADGWRIDDDRYRLTTVDDRTIAVVTGNESFVDNATVTQEDGAVTVAGDNR